MKMLGDGPKKWLEAIHAIQVLIRPGMPDQNQIFVGLIAAAFQNPLIRMACIDNEGCIAHIIPFSGKKIGARNSGNPLENCESSIGKNRAKLVCGDTPPALVIERNMGHKTKDPLRRELESAAERLGRQSEGPLGIDWELASQHSHLVHALSHNFGSAFEWKSVGTYELTRVGSIELVERKGDIWRDTPTFNLILRSLPNSSS